MQMQRTHNTASFQSGYHHPGTKRKPNNEKNQDHAKKRLLVLRLTVHLGTPLEGPLKHNKHTLRQHQLPFPLHKFYRFKKRSLFSEGPEHAWCMEATYTITLQRFNALVQELASSPLLSSQAREQLVDWMTTFSGLNPRDRQTKPMRWRFWSFTPSGQLC